MKELNGRMKPGSVWRTLFVSALLIAGGTWWKVAKYRHFVESGINEKAAMAMALGPLVILGVIVLVIAWHQTAMKPAGAHGSAAAVWVGFLSLPALFYGAVVQVDDLAARSGGMAITAQGFWGNLLGLAALAMGFTSLVSSPASGALLAVALWRRRFPWAVAAILVVMCVLALASTLHVVRNFL